MLLEGFDALLQVHGSEWSYNGRVFKAIAQSGAYAAYNFADGNTAVRILRFKSRDLPALPIKGEKIVSAFGAVALVQNSRRIDGDFSELEIDEI